MQEIAKVWTSAHSKDANAQYGLALCYANGNGIARNESLEIECDCFDSVLPYMMVNHRDNITIDGNVVTNENMTGFRNEFVRCMDVIGQFSTEKYIIRAIHENGTVTLYTKEVLQNP